MTKFDQPVAVFGAVYEGDPEGNKGQGPLVHDTMYPPMCMVAEHYGWPVEKLNKYLIRDGMVIFRNRRDITVVMQAHLHENNRSGSVH